MRLIHLFKIWPGKTKRLINEDPSLSKGGGGRGERSYLCCFLLCPHLGHTLGTLTFPVLETNVRGWRAERDPEPEFGSHRDRGPQGDTKTAVGREAATPPGFLRCLYPFLGLRQTAQAAKASSVRGHREFGVMDDGAMVGTGGLGAEEVGWLAEKPVEPDSHATSHTWPR